MDIPLIYQAALWGALSGSALLIGSAMGCFLDLSSKIVAGIMAFGSGVLISALSFGLMEEAANTGGMVATAQGFVCGALIYTVLNRIVSSYGAKHRKRSNKVANNNETVNSSSTGLAIAIGALLDGIPESIVIGLSLIGGGQVGLVTIAAVFISNLPEGLSSSVGMKNSGRSTRYIFTIWGAIALACAFASFAGYALFQNSSEQLVAGVMSLAAGAILAMIVDTMIPEAFEGAHDFAGLITVAGFLVAFVIDKA